MQRAKESATSTGQTETQASRSRIRKGRNGGITSEDSHREVRSQRWKQAKHDVEEESGLDDMLKNRDQYIYKPATLGTRKTPKL